MRDARAYLVRIVTRQALNLLRSVARRREQYVGDWLPEPLLTSPDVAADIELAENLSIAMLTVLETLGPVERAVFVLREVFDTPYDEIAAAVGKSPAAVRQIAHRARDHVAGSPPADAGQHDRAAGGRGTVPRRRPGTATSRASSTSLRPTSSSWPTEAAWSRLFAVRSRVRNAWPLCSSPVPACKASRRGPSGSTGRPPSGSRSAISTTSR